MAGLQRIDNMTQFERLSPALLPNTMATTVVIGVQCEYEASFQDRIGQKSKDHHRGSLHRLGYQLDVFGFNIS